jgi:DNA-binding NtrC family response regulator
MTKHQSDTETILVVDDSEVTLDVIKRNLQGRGFRVITASNATDAVEQLGASAVDLVITDFRMPGPSGLELTQYVRQNYLDTEVMMVTGYATVEGAVEAVKSGAEEYLKKPFTDEELFVAVERTLDRLHVRRAARSRSVATPTTPYGVIGESEKMQQIYSSVAKAARSTATVLVTGESGTGKELIARAIHYSGSREAAPFVTVNCGSIPENLLESELFGHVKGSFTGAEVTRAGFFQTADRGTIFLDEVSETSPAMQVKLLRVLQEGEVYMLGSTRARKVDVRVVAATNKDLSGLVEKGGFREDLYYRLNVIPLELPPLRERGDDIYLLVSHFTETFANQSERPIPVFTDGALELLRRYHWPGNVRELQNLVNRLLVMVDGNVIDGPDLPDLMRGAAPRLAGYDRTLAEVEHEYIRNVLERADGNKSRAAQILGISRKTLRERLKKY